MENTLKVACVADPQNACSTAYPLRIQRKSKRSRWWRAYDEALNDPKLQQLRPELFRDWFNLLCLASENGGTLPALEAISFKLRKTPTKMERNLRELIAAGLFDAIDDNGTIAPHNWSERQYQSDTSTDRVQRFRAKEALRNAA